MKKIWSTLDFFRKLLLTTQVQYRMGHCIFCGQIFCCCVLKSNPPPSQTENPPSCKVEVPVQHQATPWFCVLRATSQVSETPLLALAPLAIFIIADQLEILFFFNRQEFSCHLFLLSLGGSKEKKQKQPYLLQTTLQRKTRLDPLGLQNFSSLRHRCLVIPIVIQLRLLPWGARDRTWNKCFYHPWLAQKQLKQKSLPVSPSSQVLGSQRLYGHEGQKSNSYFM